MVLHMKKIRTFWEQDVWGFLLVAWELTDVSLPKVPLELPGCLPQGGTDYLSWSPLCYELFCNIIHDTIFCELYKEPLKSGSAKFYYEVWGKILLWLYFFCSKERCPSALSSGSWAITQLQKEVHGFHEQRRFQLINGFIIQKSLECPNSYSSLKAFMVPASSTWRSQNSLLYYLLSWRLSSFPIVRTKPDFP